MTNSKQIVLDEFGCCANSYYPTMTSDDTQWTWIAESNPSISCVQTDMYICVRRINLGLFSLYKQLRYILETWSRKGFKWWLQASELLSYYLVCSPANLTSQCQTIYPEKNNYTLYTLYFVRDFVQVNGLSRFPRNVGEQAPLFTDLLLRRHHAHTVK